MRKSHPKSGQLIWRNARVGRVISECPRRPSLIEPRDGKLKVLVVDDELESLLDTAEVFRSGGFDVLTASSGSEALEVLTSEPGIRMLITDVLMPEMDGVTLGRKARALVPGIEVVLVSLLPSVAMEAHAGEPGEFAFLMKPFSMSEVELMLRK